MPPAATSGSDTARRTAADQRQQARPRSAHGRRPRRPERSGRRRRHLRGRARRVAEATWTSTRAPPARARATSSRRSPNENDTHGTRSSTATRGARPVDVEHEVHAERAVRRPRDRADLLAQDRRIGPRGAERPEATGPRHLRRRAPPQRRGRAAPAGRTSRPARSPDEQDVAERDDVGRVPAALGRRQRTARVTTRQRRAGHATRPGWAHSGSHAPPEGSCTRAGLDADLGPTRDVAPRLRWRGRPKMSLPVTAARIWGPARAMCACSPNGKRKTLGSASGRGQRRGREAQTGKST